MKMPTEEQFNETMNELRRTRYHVSREHYEGMRKIENARHHLKKKITQIIHKKHGGREGRTLCGRAVMWNTNITAIETDITCATCFKTANR